MSEKRKVTPSALMMKKQRGQPITMLTAYDCPMAKFINQAGIDIILVSDALGTVGLGRSEAVSVTVEEMIYHAKACRNGAGTSMLICTLPFGSYHSPVEARCNATRLMKEGGIDGIHLEGDAKDSESIQAIVDAGIPVMGHIGITKQKIIRSGRFVIQGRSAVEAVDVVKDAIAFKKAGVFALILECIPALLAESITRSFDIPTIGIGAGRDCDGQALVTQDMLGIYKELSPRFLKIYVDIQNEIVNAFSTFRAEVESGIFPGHEHSYEIPNEELSELVGLLKS